jgi:hypothetical protein
MPATDMWSLNEPGFPLHTRKQPGRELLELAFFKSPRTGLLDDSCAPEAFENQEVFITGCQAVRVGRFRAGKNQVIR